MKTDRLTLLIAPAEKAAIAARAEALGLPLSEYVRRASEAYDPADAELLEQLRALVPQLHAAAADMRADIAAALDAAAQTEAFLATRDKRRADLIRELEADPSINWAGIQRVLGLDALAGRMAA
jgi:isopropylmalate/homocitrate/citramalate synthase